MENKSIKKYTEELQDSIVQAIRQFELETGMRITEINEDTEGYGAAKKITKVRFSIET